MNPLCQQYMDNLTTAGALSKPVFPPDAGQDQVLARIRGNAAESYRLRRENDGLLEEFLFSRPPEARLALDIVTVADSMDAATDDVGRSYAEAKSFDALAEELRQGAGRRYAPRIVALLDDPALYADLSRRLSEERQRIYCDIYRELGRS